MRRAHLLLLLGLAVGCERSFSELTPFPCPADGHCPDGLACVAALGCAPAQPDALCHGENGTDDPATDCSPAGTMASCVNGRCEAHCPASGSCSPGRVCSASASAATSGACLKDCTTSASACPAGMQCAPLYTGTGKHGCIDARAPAPTACLTFSTTASCNGVPFLCGAANWNVACAAGGSCPDNSSCITRTDGSIGCRCNAGYTATSCSGTVCNGSCSYPDYGCKPDSATPTAVGCNDDPAQVQGSCHCRDGRTLESPCGTVESCEQRCRA